MAGTPAGRNAGGGERNRHRRSAARDVLADAGGNDAPKVALFRT